MSQNGKGSKPRPVKGDVYRSNWDRIFRQPKRQKSDKPRRLKDGEPCSHPGCLSHLSHPCEGCGRIAGVSRKPLKMCRAGQDGECWDPSCPQLHDGEPEKTGRGCPLPHFWEMLRGSD